MAQAASHPKLLLIVDQRIAHLKSKGVTFELCSEEEAACYLVDRTYYELAAYRVLFDRRVARAPQGLAASDRDLRYALLPLALDVERAARTKLVRILAVRPDEDGYSVVVDYMESFIYAERHRCGGEVNMLAADAFFGDVVRRCGKAEPMAAWVLMGFFSFGSFIDPYLFLREPLGRR